MRLRLAVVVLAFVTVACARGTVDLSRPAPATLQAEPAGFETARVERIVDGDTIEVTITGRTDGRGAGLARIGSRYDVRLLGIDTPESVDPRRPVECYGRESSAATAAFIDDQEVTLVKDTEEADRYDRLLRYVYLGGEMVNARLVLNGYASVYTYPPNVRHSGMFVELQRRARRAGAGLWSEKACGGADVGS